jgi:hypothetical protein
MKTSLGNIHEYSGLIVGIRSKPVHDIMLGQWPLCATAFTQQGLSLYLFLFSAVQLTRKERQSDTIKRIVISPKSWFLQM